MSDFILGGKPFRELDIRVLQSSQVPILSETVDRTITIPGKHGAYDFGADLSPYLFELECKFIRVKSPADLQQKARALAAHISNHDGSPRTMPFTLPAEPDVFYNVRYSGLAEIRRLAVMGIFQLPLVAFDPFAYGEEQEEAFSNGSITVNNAGTVETFPKFTVKFTSAAPEWKVSLGDKFVRVVRDFDVGDVLEVDFSTGKISINGINNISYLDWQNSQFFSLLPGQNTLTVEPTGVSNTTIKYNPRWV